MLVVLIAFVALATALTRGPHLEAASEIDTALMIDLPPVVPSGPAGGADDGPPQEAAEASAAEKPEERIEPQKPVAEPKTSNQAETPPPPPQSKPQAVLEEKREDAKPPQPTAPSSAPQEVHAPSGSDAPDRRETDQGEEGRPRASAQAITRWQRSLMRRLEAAKRAFGHEARMAGTVKIAFEIDAKGNLVSERIVQSSGLATLDNAASALVRQAAPFPAPPAGAGHRETSFVVPILFRH